MKESINQLLIKYKLPKLINRSINPSPSFCFQECIQNNKNQQSTTMNQSIIDYFAIAALTLAFVMA